MGPGPPLIGAGLIGIISQASTARGSALLLAKDPPGMLKDHISPSKKAGVHPAPHSQPEETAGQRKGRAPACKGSQPCVEPRGRGRRPPHAGAEEREANSL